jgi:hypothetical protein
MNLERPVKEATMPKPILVPPGRHERSYCEPDGTRHRVTLRRVRRAWWVLDITERAQILVDTVGFPDTLDAAWALADDYSVQQQAWRLGLREEDPLLRPLVLSEVTARGALSA